MHTRIAALLPLAALSAVPVGAQRLPPLRPLGAVVTVSARGVLGSVSAVRRLPDGSVIVHDLTRRQVILLDRDFKKLRTIADTTPETGMAYGARLCGLMAFTGDSSLFIDPESQSMAVIDGHGVVARVMAVPNPEDATLMVGGPFGTPGMDPSGRIVYRGYGAAKDLPLKASEASALDSAAHPDSAPVYRMSLTTRQRETIGKVAIPRATGIRSFDAAGRISGTVLHMTPLPVVDDWALTPDGRIAVVRGADYHLEWLGLDGRWSATPKIPHNWQRLDDATKQRLLDSARTELEQEREKLQQLVTRLGNDMRAIMSAGGESPLRAGVTFTLQRPDATSGAPRMEVKIPTVRLVDAKDLPDYRPAFRMGAVRVDADGNLWVRTTVPSDAGPIYDVIDAKGVLKDRVKIPFGRVISGFGPGVVYMGVLEDAGARLEMARVK